MRFIFWHKTVNRPITNADAGKFVVGRSPTEWMAGYIVENHDPSGPRIDTKYRATDRNLCANFLRVYAFISGPSPDLDETLIDPPAKVIRLRP